MKKKRTKKEITNREMWLGILIAIFGAVVDFCFFGFSYSADPQGEHGEIYSTLCYMDSTFDRGRVLNELFLKRQKLPLRLLRLSDTLARCRLSAALRLLRVALSRVWADSRKAIPQQDHARKYARFVSDIRASANSACLCAVFSRTASCQKARRLNIKNTGSSA